MVARLLQKLQKNYNGKLPKASNRRKPYDAIATLAFTMMRWFALFVIGIAILTSFTAFAFSHALAEAIWTNVMPLVKLFGTTTFFVLALACLKESI